MVEQPKSKLTKPESQTTIITLYYCKITVIESNAFPIAPHDAFLGFNDRFMPSISQRWFPVPVSPALYLHRSATCTLRMGCDLVRPAAAGREIYTRARERFTYQAGGRQRGVIVIAD